MSRYFLCRDDVFVVVVVVVAMIQKTGENKKATALQS
jgi:hypothetical protein